MRVRKTPLPPSPLTEQRLPRMALDPVPCQGCFKLVLYYWSYPPLCRDCYRAVLPTRRAHAKEASL